MVKSIIGLLTFNISTTWRRDKVTWKNWDGGDKDFRVLLIPLTGIR